LGVAVSKTGLALWILDILPIDQSSLAVTAFLFSYTAAILSNFMSNTAATNILVPIALAIGGGASAQLVIPIALGASSAMCLPISTPPNAIAYARGSLKNTDFLRGGLIIGLIAPAISVLWCIFILN